MNAEPNQEKQTPKGTKRRMETDEKGQKRPKNTDNESDQKWVCPVEGCSCSYGRKGDLKFHWKTKHPDLGALLVTTYPSLSRDRSSKVDKQWPCPVPECPSGYGRLSDLKSHFVRVHTTLIDEYPHLVPKNLFECTICHIKFSRQQALDYHMEGVHLGKRRTRRSYKPSIFDDSGEMSERRQSAGTSSEIFSPTSGFEEFSEETSGASDDTSSVRGHVAEKEGTSDLKIKEEFKATITTINNPSTTSTPSPSVEGFHFPSSLSNVPNPPSTSTNHPSSPSHSLSTPFSHTSPRHTSTPPTTTTTTTTTTTPLFTAPLSTITTITTITTPTTFKKAELKMIIDDSPPHSSTVTNKDSTLNVDQHQQQQKQHLPTYKATVPKVPKGVSQSDQHKHQHHHYHHTATSPHHNQHDHHHHNRQHDHHHHNHNHQHQHYHHTATSHHHNQHDHQQHQHQHHNYQNYLPHHYQNYQIHHSYQQHQLHHNHTNLLQNQHSYPSKLVHPETIHIHSSLYTNERNSHASLSSSLHSPHSNASLSSTHSFPLKPPLSSSLHSFPSGSHSPFSPGHFVNSPSPSAYQTPTNHFPTPSHNPPLSNSTTYRLASPPSTFQPSLPSSLPTLQRSRSYTPPLPLPSLNTPSLTPSPLSTSTLSPQPRLSPSFPPYKPSPPSLRSSNPDKQTSPDVPQQPCRNTGSGDISRILN